MCVSLPKLSFFEFCSAVQLIFTFLQLLFGICHSIFQFCSLFSFFWLSLLFYFAFFPIYEIYLQKANGSSNGFRVLVFSSVLSYYLVHICEIIHPLFGLILQMYRNMCFYHLIFYILNCSLSSCHVVLLVARRCKEGTLKKLRFIWV